MRPFILPLALLLIARSATAQVVQGLVVAEGDKRPLAGVRVALLDEKTILKETTTDSVAGSFYFDSPAPGRLQLAIYDRLGNAFLSPAFDADTGATIERKLVLPDLPVSYNGLPVSSEGPIRPTPGHFPVPRYPDSQRRIGRTGVVHIAVIVDESGHVVPGSEYVAASSDDAFTDAVRQVIGDLEFATAAERARPPRVIVNTTFSFDLDGKPRQPCVVKNCIEITGYISQRSYMVEKRAPIP
jgi:hypothetical protein